jgi:NADPH:quinone reductase-like Zn-dependent oxidoreductase
VSAYAIQLAHAYLIPVVAVCSPLHFDRCKTLGATHLFDYHDANVARNIKAAAPNIAHVFDCIGTESSSATASQAVAETGGVVCTVRPGNQFTEKVAAHVKAKDVLVWTVFMKDHRYKEFS